MGFDMEFYSIYNPRMLLVYDYVTSRSFWRLAYPADRTPGKPCPTPPLDRIACNVSDVRRVISDWVTPELLALDDDRVHLLAFDRNCRRSSHFHEVRAWTSPLPDGSLYDLGTGAYVSSPAFMFLQTAATHSLVETIAFGNELCGSYAFDPFHDRGIKSRRPLTTISTLERYISQAAECHGYRQAKRAIPYLIEKSASPMESADEMLMCLPYSLGGYGLRKPVMNHPVELSESAAHIARRSICYADICWPDSLIDVEHHGLHDHANNNAFTSDRARVNGLVEMGFEVIELTFEQVKDLRSFELIVLGIAKKLGKRIDRKKLGSTPERTALRDELFAWNRRGGRHSRQTGKRS